MKRTVAILLIVTVLAGCSNKRDLPGVKFRPSQLTKTEATALGLKTSLEPHVFRAVCRDGPPRDVCLQSAGLGGFWHFYSVAVFFPNGKLDEATRINVPEGYEPYRLLQVSLPTVVWFRDPTGRRKDSFNVALSEEDMQRRARETRKALQQSLSAATNVQVAAALRRRLAELPDETTASTKTVRAQQPSPGPYPRKAANSLPANGQE